MQSKCLRLLLKLSALFFFLSFLALMASCAHAPPKPAQFDTAIRTMAQDLLKRVYYHHTASDQSATRIHIVLDPFFDADSGEVLNVSRQIEAIFFEEQRNKFPHISLKRLGSDSLAEAQYIIRGEIRLDSIASATASESPEQRLYHVSASAENKKRVIALADAWVSNQNLDYAGAGIHADTPMFIIDPHNEKARAIIESRVGAPVDPQSAKFLETKAILVEAGTAYEKEDYKKALQLFEKAAMQDDGQVMETYAGLYLTHYVLNQRRKAEDAFAQLVDISVRKTGSLSVKFLFEVNQADFLNNKNLRAQYYIWIKKIGEYFRHSNLCLQIIGHCSKTGPAKWNDKLSGMRAQRIQHLMRRSFPEIKQRSQAIGKGYNENIVGIGSDDERDALDRRVEFKLADCNAIK